MAIALGACTPTPTEVIDETLGGGSGTTAGSALSTGTAAAESTDDGSGSGDTTGPPQGPMCGDGVVEGDEECDLGDGQNGMGGAACRDNCVMNVCGDGYVAEGELCDDGNTNNEDDCTNDCGPASCGDGVTQPPEQCDDGKAGNSQTGACLPSCVSATCGDGFIQTGVEVCDNANVTTTCVDQGFDGGTIVCAPDCMSIDTSNCFACGNGVLEASEECDMGNFGGLSCADYGPGGTTPAGSLVCSAECIIDANDCTFCGDGLQEGPEDCDGGALGGATCVSEGFDAGTLECAMNCTFDTSMCTECGNGVREGAEQCDMGDLGGETCADQPGFDAGPLGCAANCMLDTSNCTTCDDGTIEGGEVCDGMNLQGETCVGLGAPFDGGMLACGPTCETYDTSNCCFGEGESCMLNEDCCSGNCFAMLCGP